MYCSLVYQFEHSGKVYNEPGLNLALRIFILHCYQARPHSSVLCADESAKDETVLSAD